MNGYPRLHEGLVAVPVDDGILVEGGPSRLLLRGQTASALLPRLLPLLDGTREAGDVAGALGEPAETIERVLELLEHNGIVRTSGEVTAFPRGGAVAARLRRSASTVIGGGGVAARLAGLLRESGVGTVEHVDAPDGRTDLPGQADDPGSGLLTVEVRTPTDAPGRPVGRTPWLRVCVSSRKVEIGPLFNVAGGRCHACFQRGGHDWYPEGPGLTAAAEAIAAGLAAGSVLRFLGGYGTSWVGRGVAEFCVEDGRQAERLVPHDPGCADCGTPATRLAPTGRDLLAYEETVERPLHCDALVPMEQGNAAAKDYLTAPRLRTPGTGRGAAVAPEHTRPLFRILGLAATIRRTEVSPGARNPRRTASGLGLVHWYVLGRDDLDVFYFDPTSAELVTLNGPGTSGDDVQRFDQGQALVVALTGDLAAGEQRFGAAGRRVVYQDCGIALGRLQLACLALGRRASVRAAWSEEAIARAAGLDPTRETVAAVVDVRPGGGPAVPQDLLTRQSMTYGFTAQPVPAATIARVAGTALDVAGALWHESGLAVEPLLLARDVPPLDAGLYGPLEDGWAVTGHGGARLAAFFAESGLVFPAALLFTGDLVAALDGDGPAGYRTLLEQGAAAAYAALAAAAGEGLAAGLLVRAPAGAVEEVTGAAVGRRRVLMGVVLGYDGKGRGTHLESVIRW